MALRRGLDRSSGRGARACGRTSAERRDFKTRGPWRRSGWLGAREEGAGDPAAGLRALTMAKLISSE